MTDEYFPSTDLNMATGGEDTEPVVSSKGSDLEKNIFDDILY
jgi:hypothetical protein